MLTYATIYQYISNQQTYFKRIIYLRQKYVKSSDSLAFTPHPLLLYQPNRPKDGRTTTRANFGYSLFPVLHENTIIND